MFHGFSPRNVTGAEPPPPALERSYDVSRGNGILAILFARTDKKVGTVPTCSRRIFLLTNFNQSRCRILVFASRRVNKVAKWKIRLNQGVTVIFS